MLRSLFVRYSLHMQDLVPEFEWGERCSSCVLACCVELFCHCHVLSVNSRRLPDSHCSCSARVSWWKTTTMCLGRCASWIGTPRCVGWCTLATISCHSALPVVRDGRHSSTSFRGGPFRGCDDSHVCCCRRAECPCGAFVSIFLVC